jgi:hypothetical protein
MSRIEGETVIDRPVEEVFDFVADERNRYDPRIQRAEKLTDGPIGRGTRFRSETKSAGRTVGLVVEITEYERPCRLATSAETSSMTIRSTLDFDRVPEGTRVRWSSELEPRGALRIVKPILAPIVRRQAESIYAHLKGVLESGG